MTVKAILESKGRYIYSVEPDERLSAAVKTLAERRVGAVLVMRGTRLDGILSERDIVKACARHGSAALDSSAADLMTREVITVTPDDTIATVMERMTAGRFRHMPVLKEGRIVGVISIGDVVKHRIAQAEREAEEMRSYIATA